MKRFAIIPPAGDLIEEVAGRCNPSGNDYAETLVVFPGKRPAHFLRSRIATQRNTAFIPPVILSMEEFIDRIYERAHPATDRRLETIDAVAFLFEIHRAMERPLGGKEFLNLDTFFPLGLRIYRDIEELLIEQIDVRRLKSVEDLIETRLPPQTDAELQSLSFFFQRFYSAIKEEGFSSRSERFRFVSSELEPAMLPFRKVIFAGFYALTECERRLFEKLLSWDSAFFLFQQGPGMNENLSRLGISEASAFPEETSSSGEGPDLYFHKSPDSHGQVFDLAGILNSQIEKGAAESPGANDSEDAFSLGRIVIVLPSSETLFPLLYHALPLIPKEEYNISLGYPLERTPTWGFLNSLIQAVTSMDEDRLYIPDYLSLVLHPYVKNLYMRGSAETTRIIFHALEEALIEDRTKSFVRLDEIEGDSKFFQMVSQRTSGAEGQASPSEIREHLKMIHETVIRKTCSFESIGDFAGKMIGILAFVYDHSSARLHPYFHPFAESFMKELDLLRGSRVKKLSFSERNSYFLFLKRYVAQCFTPFDGTPLRGAQVLGFLETRNLRFEQVFILDANEGVIPDTRKEESLLPTKVRKILSMPTYQERDMLSAYYFHTLIAGARCAHIFFPENGKKEKSRFVEQMLWERQRKEEIKNADSYIRSVGYRLSLENSLPPEIQKSASVTEFLGSRSYDATSLDVYLHCPLQFYYRYVLNLSRREEAGPDVERLDIGKIVHKVLFTYFKRRMNTQLDERLIDFSEMREVAGLVFEEAYGPLPIGKVYLLKRQILKQMEAFLKYYQVPLINRAKCEILHLERRLETVISSFRFKGILDRVEKRDDDTCIVDYKTGASATRLACAFDRLDVDNRKSWNEAIGSLQLPFYLFLYERTTGLSVEKLKAMFLLLGKARLSEEAELPLFGKNDEVDECYAKIRGVIHALVREITDPDVPFDPQKRAKNACRSCDFRHLCAAE